MLKGAIYDLDGLMVDSEKLHARAFEKVLGEYGHSLNDVPKEEYSKYIGTKVRVFADALREYLNIPEDPEKFYQKRIDAFLEIAEKEITLMPGLIQSLNLFKESGFKTGLASSGIKKYINMVIDKFDLSHYFDAVITADCVEKGKPHPEPYLMATEKLGIAPDFCVVLEDAKNGVISAKGAGCKCIGVLGKRFPPQDLSEADLVLKSLEELDIDIIKKLG